MKLHGTEAPAPYVTFARPRQQPGPVPGPGNPHYTEGRKGPGDNPYWSRQICKDGRVRIPPRRRLTIPAGA